MVGLVFGVFVEGQCFLLIITEPAVSGHDLKCLLFFLLLLKVKLLVRVLGKYDVILSDWLCGSHLLICLERARIVTFFRLLQLLHDTSHVLLKWII